MAAQGIGIVGLGKIGGAIAINLLAAGHAVSGWARRPETLDQFIAQGGRAATSLADLCHAPIILSVVFDDAAVREIAFGPDGLLEAMPAGTVHVAMETISPVLSRELAEAHLARGQRYIAAPVFGRPDAAVRGELAIICSGAEQIYQDISPLLAPAGTCRWVGPEPEQAMLVKLVGNHMILTVGEMLGEAFALLSAAGVDASTTKAALFDQLMPTIMTGYAARMVDQPDAPRPAGSAIGRKDNALLLDAASLRRIELPLADFLRREVIEPGSSAS